MKMVIPPPGPGNWGGESTFPDLTMVPSQLVTAHPQIDPNKKKKKGMYWLTWLEGIVGR